MTDPISNAVTSAWHYWNDPVEADAQHTLLGTVKDLALTILGVFAGRP
jgi:hypothetical protein